MKTVAIIQARMGSERLPGKVLLEICGQPMLRRVVDRVALARGIDQVVVATSTEARDGEIEKFCRDSGIACFRGHPSDVLDRYYRAASAFGADHVVRITSDCPLIDPGLIGTIVEAYTARQPQIQYASNVIVPRRFPRGLDTEIFSAAALEQAWRETEAPVFREHVTTYFYHHPERFRLHGIHQVEDDSHHRWTVDTPDDLRLIREIFAALPPGTPSWRDVLALVAQHPEWESINAHIRQKAA